MTVQNTQLDLEREYIINALKYKLKLTDDFLNSMSLRKLKELYKNVFHFKSGIYKMKSRKRGQYVEFYIPQKIVDKLDLEYGDRFNIKVNIHKKIIYLDKAKNGMVKMGINNMVRLPSKLIEKRLLLEDDDILIMHKNGRIMIQSFGLIK